jgi:hypothetical protein
MEIASSPKLPTMVTSMIAVGTTHVKPCDCLIAKAQTISRIPAATRQTQAISASPRGNRVVPELLPDVGEVVLAARSCGASTGTGKLSMVHYGKTGVEPVRARGRRSLNATDPMLAKGQVRAVPVNDLPAQRAFVHRILGLAT